MISYNTWFKNKVLEALESLAPTISHKEAMLKFKLIINSKER